MRVHEQTNDKSIIVSATLTTHYSLLTTQHDQSVTGMSTTVNKKVLVHITKADALDYRSSTEGQAVDESTRSSSKKTPCNNIHLLREAVVYF